MFLRGWLTEEYLDDHFDGEGGGTSTPPASGNGGISRARLLGTRAPRPRVPPWRQLGGDVGKAMTDVRNYLNELDAREITWGNHVTVTFTAADTSVAVDTGLGGAAKGYTVVKSSADVRVYDGTPPTPDVPRGTIYLKATAPATVTLYIY